jgi:hypothetical protein
MNSVEGNDRPVVVTVTEHKPENPSPEWEAERDASATVLVRVLLRARERLIREGRMQP